jgi:hypothetical protein
MSPLLDVSMRSCERCGSPAGRRFDARLSVALLLLAAVGTWWIIGWPLLLVALWMWSRPARLCPACRPAARSSDR